MLRSQSHSLRQRLGCLSPPWILQSLPFASLTVLEARKKKFQKHSIHSFLPGSILLWEGALDVQVPAVELQSSEASVVQGDWLFHIGDGFTWSQEMKGSAEIKALFPQTELQELTCPSFCFMTSLIIWNSLYSFYWQVRTEWRQGVYQESEGVEEVKEEKGVMDGWMDFIERQVSKIAQINCASKVLILDFWL